jgi:hypothetical protein
MFDAAPVSTGDLMRHKRIIPMAEERFSFFAFIRA